MKSVKCWTRTRILTANSQKYDLTPILESMSKHEHPGEALLEFAGLRKIVSFDAYYEAEKNYADRREP